MSILNSRNMVLAFGLVVVLSAPSRADQVFNFNTPVQLGAAHDPGKWYTDRFAPYGFVSPLPSGSGILQQTINGGDFQANAFYNTQGRAYDVETGTLATQISVLVDPTWTLAANPPADGYTRFAGFWGITYSGSSVTDPSDRTGYPIIEVVGGAGGFGVRTYDSETGAWSGVTGVTAGDTISLGFSVSSTGLVSYFLNGSMLGSGYTLSEPTLGIGTVMLQGHNYGNSYNIQWSGLATSTSAVPEPASVVSAFIALGAAAAVAVGRARRPAAA